jgi:hypothetical protein
MDALQSLGEFTLSELCQGMERFRGRRGVVQGRALAAIVDGRAQSPGESALRLRWYDAGLPPRELQWRVPSPHGTAYFLDLAWLRSTATPTLIVLRSVNVYGRQQDAEALLRNAALDNPNQCSRHRFW